MPRIEWNESLSVGIAEIDEQHRKWISLINTLHDVLMGYSKEDSLTPETCLQAMLDYGNYHLTFEEQLLENAGYPLLEQHRREHDQFRRQIENALLAEQEGHRLLQSEVMNLLTSWLEGHIMGSDMLYKDRLCLKA